jgi:signal peptidase I
MPSGPPNERDLPELPSQVWTGTSVVNSGERSDQAAPETASGELDRPTKPGKHKRKGAFGFFKELPVLLLIAFLLALLIKTFLVQAFYIPSESMVPTLEVGDRVLVNKVVYHLHPPRRGDVIVFAEPNTGPAPQRNPLSAFVHWLTEGLGLTTNPEKDFIKRVIALPGQTIEITRQCVVLVDNEPVDEPYLNSGVPGHCAFPLHRVASDSVFVMGDNRGNSRDSRFGLGDIPLDRVVGRAFVIIWPPPRTGWLQAA